jgi:hypothetical protein
MAKAQKQAADVTGEQIAGQLDGEENRAIRLQLAKFLAARRRCQATGFGRVALVTEYHASRALNGVEVSEKEAE